MALTPRKHGVNITEVDDGRRAIALVATSIWGLVTTAGDADVDAFPLDTPVLVTDLDAALGDAGSDGTLSRALRAIRDQARSIGVVVRVAEGEGEDAEDIAADQAAKVIGASEDGVRTGMQALLDAEAKLGVRPRILGAPGLDDQAVAVALGVLARDLRGFGYVGDGGLQDVAGVEAYRSGFSDRELMMIHGDFLAFDAVAAENVVSFAVARAMGLRARLDLEVGYHKTISNVPVAGVTGVTRPVTWDLQSPQTDVGVLNGADCTAIIRRDGFRFWGNRTLSGDPRYAFESAVRTNQVLRDTIAEGVFPFIDQPLTRGLALDLIESINALLRAEVRAGRLIGAECFLAEGNTPDQLAQGKLRIGYRFTFVPPLEDLGVESTITDEFFADFANFNQAA